MYRAKMTFRDLEDGHLYNTGDPFPFDGREIRQERIEALVTGQNLAQKPLIYQDEENINQAVEQPEKPKKRARTKK